MKVRHLHITGTHYQIEQIKKFIYSLDLNLKISCEEPINKGLFTIEFTVEGGIMEVARLDEYLYNLFSTKEQKKSQTSRK